MRGREYRETEAETETPPPADIGSLSAGTVVTESDIERAGLKSYFKSYDISDSLLSIFRELYDYRYPIQKMKLVDDYGADDIASAADNNTSCFNFRRSAGVSSSLSRHAYGKAIDINPLYNPYVWWDEEGVEHCDPDNGSPYMDRDASFPYKITEDDICVQIFTKYGFTWGGSWSNEKDYMHFSVTS